jgi:hypothetical protein
MQQTRWLIIAFPLSSRDGVKHATSRQLFSACPQANQYRSAVALSPAHNSCKAENGTCPADYHAPGHYPCVPLRTTALRHRRILGYRLLIYWKGAGVGLDLPHIVDGPVQLLDSQGSAASCMGSASVWRHTSIFEAAPGNCDVGVDLCG